MAKKPVALVTGASGIGLALTTDATVNRRS